MNFDHDSALEITDMYRCLCDRAIEMQNMNVSPDSEDGVKFAEEFWNMITKFTGGDMSILPKLMEIGTLAESGEIESPNGFDMQKQAQASNFIGLSLE